MKKNIIILLAAFFLSFKMNAQSKNLTIKVKDEKNKPVAGAIILIDDVKQKRWTNSKGIYKIKLNEPPKKITAFHPNIGISKIKYTDKKKHLIIIKKGYETHIFENYKKQITPTRFNNIYDYLRGKVSGVNITSGGSITIRGYNSINGNMTPLFILDGIEISEDMFGQIMPDEIKSVTVLKGPDSAVYGLRSANGVIVVKTNKN